MRLFVVVQDDEIIVTSETGFRAAYCKRPNNSSTLIEVTCAGVTELPFVKDARHC